MLKGVLRGAAAMLLVGGTACAHNQPQVGATSELTSTPTLIGCPGYTAPTFHWTEANRVSIRMRVQPDGSVEPGSLRHSPSRFDRGGQSAVERALALAEACSFEPAYADDGPVEAWTSVRFAFD